MSIYQKILNRVGLGKKDITFNARTHNPTVFGILGDFFNFSFGGGSFAKYVNAFGTNPLVYMIVNKISTNESSLPRIYLNDAGDIIDDSVIAELMRKPNPDQYETEFRDNIDKQILVTGNAFIRAQTEAVGFTDIILTVLESEKIDIVIDSAGIVSGYLYKLDNLEIQIPAEEILHIKTVNIVNTKEDQAHYGFSPLESAFNIIKASNEIFEAEAAIFKNRGVVGILSNETDVPMFNKDRERLQKEFNADVGGASKFNQIHVTNTKLKYLQMGMSPTDLKLLEGILNKLRLICSIYGLNSVLFNDQISSTFNNVVEANRSAFIDVYIPLGRKIDRALSPWLSEKLGVSETIKINENKIDVLKMVNKELSDAVVAQFEKGLITADEARDALGYEASQQEN